MKSKFFSLCFLFTLLLSGDVSLEVLKNSNDVQEIIATYNVPSAKEGTQYSLYSSDYNGFNTEQTTISVDGKSDESLKQYITFGSAGEHTVIFKLTDYSLTTMEKMFYKTQIASIKFNNFHPGNVISTSSMFEGADALIEADFYNMDFMSLETAESMFYNAKSLEKVNLTNFKANSLVSTNHMLDNCVSLVNLDLSSFHAPNNKG
ncbi:MAG: DUF285 domain-containing protein, partial [archaeon]|nr:DUF285 domain-containing protein [archaeon]